MKNIILTLLALSMLFSACSDAPAQIEPVTENRFIPISADVLPLDNRTLGINISSNKNGFYDSFENAQIAGVEIIELNIPWTAIETSPLQYTDPWGGVFEQCAFYGDNNIDVALSLAVINTVQWEVPSDLTFGNAEFIDRFNNMVSFTLDAFPDNVNIHSISIGNEVNYVLKDDEWAMYEEFVQGAYAHIKSIDSEIVVGVKTTVMGGLFDAQKDYIVSLNKYTDVVMLNYYPQDEKFRVLEPDIIYDHFDIIAEIFPDNEIWITEIGYQSGNNLCQSSEYLQAEFYHHMFTAWDEHADHITTIQIDWLHDQSPDTINEFKQYYGNDKALVEYLSTLGLRNYDGTDKLAWQQLLEEVYARQNK